MFPKNGRIRWLTTLTTLTTDCSENLHRWIEPFEATDFWPVGLPKNGGLIWKVPKSKMDENGSPIYGHPQLVAESGCCATPGTNTGRWASVIEHEASVFNVSDGVVITY